MDKVSNSSNNVQTYANQNNSQVQQTSAQANEAGEANSTANRTSSAQEQKDSSEISLFDSDDNEDESAAGYGNYDYEEAVEDDGYDPYEIIEDVDLDEEESAEAAYSAAGQAAEDAAENGNFTVEDVDFAVEAGAVSGEDMSVGKIGDDYLQSEEYYNSLRELMDNQDTENGCKILYYRSTLDKDTKYNHGQKREIAQHKDDYINMNKNGYSDFYDYMAKNSDEFKTKEEAQDYVKGRLQEVKDKFEGRAAACMSALVIQEIAAEFGVKLPYAAASTKNHVAGDIDPCNRADCSNFVSWALNQAYPDNLFAMNVGQLGGFHHMKITDKGKDWGIISEARTDDYASLPAGSICTKGKDHAMLIMYNNPDEGVIILAEASSHSNGIQLREVTYAEAKEKGYTGINPESIYDGTSDSYNYGRVKHKNN